MTDPLTLAVGAGILAVGWLAGHVTGRRAERQRHDRPREPICGCGHHRALHDPKTLECATTVEVQLRDDRNYLAGTNWRQCACRQYVGPEPITSLWTPPIAAEEADR